MAVRSKSYISWMAWRQMTSRSRKSGLSFMTIVSIFGVAIGVAALIIVLSVMGGFEQDLKNKMLRGQPHLEILNRYSAVAGYSLKKLPLENFQKLFPEAIDLEPYTEADVVLKQKRHLTSAIMFGVDPQRAGHLWGFGNAITEGTLGGIGENLPLSTSFDGKTKRPGIVLGEELAKQLAAEIGDEIAVLSPQAGVDTALGGGTVSRLYVVAGKFKTGLFNYDAKWAVVSLAEGRRFMPDYDESLQTEAYVSGIALNVKDPTKVQSMVDRVFGERMGRVDGPVHKEGKISNSKGGADDQNALASPVDVNSLSDLEPLTWEKANKSLLFALKLEKFAMGSILMLIVVVAGFSISGTMMMTVFHRRGQVSLLRSLGMSRKDITRLFLAHGATIGTVGILTGLVFGLGICAVIRSFQFVELPRGVYHLRSLPCKWLWVDYMVICSVAWVLSLLASTYPAATAAKQDPGQGLRYL